MPIVDIVSVSSGDQAPSFAKLPTPCPQRRMSAKRRLFIDDGEIDTDRLIEEQLQQHYEDSKRRWNFDFLNEKPLPGRFAWQPVNRSTAWVIDSKRLRIDSPAESIAEDQPPQMIQNKKASQSKITDFMRPSKNGPSNQKTAASATSPRVEEDSPSQPHLSQ